MANNYRVVLQAQPNPDFGQTECPAPMQCARVSSMRKAVAAVSVYIDRYDLGGGNFSGAKVYRDCKHVATISYNGRIWKEKKNARKM